MTGSTAVPRRARSGASIGVRRKKFSPKKACAKDKIVEPIQQIHPTGKSPKTLSSPFLKNIPLNPSGKSVL
jgi:hypothetical protein